MWNVIIFCYCGKSDMFCQQNKYLVYCNHFTHTGASNQSHFISICQKRETSIPFAFAHLGVHYVYFQSNR